MSREELVQRYLDGQMSRRVFLRRLIGTGVATAAALAYADVLETAPASASPADLYILMQDYSFAPKIAPIVLGQLVDFHVSSQSEHHSATDASGMGFFDTGFIDYPASFQDLSLPIAGTYQYHCKSTVHPPMTGRIRIPVKVNPKKHALGGTFTITWATSIPAGHVADVQKQNPSGSFTDWKIGVTTTSATYKPTAKGMYHFRSRMRRKSNGKHSFWSPPQAINVT